MNPEARQEIPRVLAQLLQLCPEVRVGQLMANLSYLARGPSVEAIWDVEDDELLAAAQEHLQQLAQRQTVAASA